jgi:hypothetical protein
MKRYYAAAGALLLGTSALAWAGDTDKLAVEPVKLTTEATSDMSWDKTALTAKSDLSTTSDTKLEFASLEKDLEKLAVAETDAKIQTASFDETKLDTAWSDSGKVQTASVDKVETGMGGPLEEVDTTASVVQPSNADPERDARGIPVISDVAFVPAGFNGSSGGVGGPDESNESYPACTAQVTDNCIQLYERGVRDTLASTDKVDTGLATTAKVESDSMAGVGGPYEPVDSGSVELGMSGDGRIDVAKGEVTDSDVDTVAVPTETAVAAHSEHQGVGGPVEAQSGYPPCSPGPGDDRCIQLYERGVTGAGN